MKLGKYEVRFTHYNQELSMGVLSTIYDSCRGTLCEVFSGEDKISKGSSVLHKGDNFCKEIGRKLSLKKAIKGLSKEDRTEIWEDYRVSNPKPRWNIKN